MRKTAVHAASLLILLPAITTVPAFADQILYHSGSPPDNETNGWGIYTPAPAAQNQPLWVTDQFNVGCDSTADGAEFTVYLDPGDALSSIDWAISTDPGGGSTLASGTANSFSVSYLGLRDFGANFPIYWTDEESISIPYLPLVAGTYWFTLSGGATALGGPVYWEQGSAGGSPASGAYDAYGLIPQETFQILGLSTQSQTGPLGQPGGPLGGTAPEPSSLLLLGSGLAVLAVLIRRVRRT